MRQRVAVLGAVLVMAATSGAARGGPRHLTLDEVRALVTQAAAEGRMGMARKTRLVDARPARPGEVVVTVIAGEGRETQSPPAKAGDWVVRNRCPDTGNEEYLVDGARFPDRYQPTGRPAEPDGWQEHRPAARPMRVVVLRPADGEFTFTAPWGEWMVAKPGDAIVQDPDNPGDTYRVAAASFACTYEQF
jgi:hypothetical protein